jgi:predicted permease
MLLRREKFAAELQEEMRLHLELRRAEKMENGMAERDARDAARQRFGNVTGLSERSRGAWGWRWLEDFSADVRYGLRALRKAPGFSAIAILTIALGIGATTAIFSVVDATLLHPLPFPHPEQLVTIQDDLPGVGARDVGMSVPEWWDFERSGIFEYVAPIGGGDVNLTGAAQPERIQFLNVSPNYFALLGVKPQLGRAFNPEDRTPGFNLEVLISDGLWKREFGGDPGILGRGLRLDNDTYQVVGVMPPGYHDPGRTPEERNIEIWAASGFAGDPAPPPQRSLRILQATIGRLKTGETIEAAQGRINATVGALQKQFPGDYPLASAWSVQLIPLKETVVGNVRQSLILLLGAVGLVLLIGCVNIANLLLARASGRAREMAVRQALGGARARLVRQLLTESLLLSLIGGAVGVAILFAGKNSLLRIVPENLPRLNAVTINWTVLLFALGTTLVVGAIFGIAPALQAGHTDLVHALKQEGRGSTGSAEQGRTRRVLVVLEFALSLVLMIAAGLLLRSFWDLLNVQPGFNPQNVMEVRTWLPVPNDPTTDIYRTPAQEVPLLAEILRRTSALPGAEETAIGDLAAAPLSHGWRSLNPTPLMVEGHEVPNDQAPVVNRVIVTPSYFHLLAIPLLRGRLFTEFDDYKAPLVVMINEALARTYFVGADPIGKRLKVLTPGGTRPFFFAKIVGIVADSRTESLAEASIPEVYLSFYQRRAKDLVIFVRGRLDAGAIPVQVREQVQAINPELPVFGAQMLGDAEKASLADRRFSMQVVGLFAVTALLLAGLGIYGVISYVVGERTHEIGIRLALGAQRRNILKMVLRQGLGLAITGAAIGLIGAAIVSHLMVGMLYGVRPTDLATFAGVTVLLVAIATLACYIPARRATRVDPIIALRAE